MAYKGTLWTHVWSLQPEKLRNKIKKPIFDCNSIQQLKEMTKGNAKGVLVYNAVSEERY